MYQQSKIFFLEKMIHFKIGETFLIENQYQLAACCPFKSNTSIYDFNRERVHDNITRT